MKVKILFFLWMIFIVSSPVFSEKEPWLWGCPETGLQIKHTSWFLYKSTESPAHVGFGGEIDLVLNICQELGIECNPVYGHPAKARETDLHSIIIDNASTVVLHIYNTDLKRILRHLPKDCRGEEAANSFHLWLEPNLI